MEREEGAVGAPSRKEESPGDISLDLKQRETLLQRYHLLGLKFASQARDLFRMRQDLEQSHRRESELSLKLIQLQERVQTSTHLSIVQNAFMAASLEQVQSRNENAVESIAKCKKRIAALCNREKSLLEQIRRLSEHLSAPAAEVLLTDDSSAHHAEWLCREAQLMEEKRHLTVEVQKLKYSLLQRESESRALSDQLQRRTPSLSYLPCAVRSAGAAERQESLTHAPIENPPAHHLRRSPPPADFSPPHGTERASAASSLRSPAADASTPSRSSPIPPPPTAPFHAAKSPHLPSASPPHSFEKPAVSPSSPSTLTSQSLPPAPADSSSIGCPSVSPIDSSPKRVSPSRTPPDESHASAPAASDVTVTPQNPRTVAFLNETIFSSPGSISLDAGTGASSSSFHPAVLKPYPAADNCPPSSLTDSELATARKTASSPVKQSGLQNFFSFFRRKSPEKMHEDDEEPVSQAPVNRLQPPAALQLRSQQGKRGGSIVTSTPATQLPSMAIGYSLGEFDDDF